jgi:hypothetical protein
VNINDDSLKIDAIRKLNQLNDQFIEVELSNNLGDKGELFLTCKEKHPIFREEMTECAQLTKNKGIPTIKL